MAAKGSSVPSERVASVAGNIVTYKRSRLTPEFVEILTIGSMNWKFLEGVQDLEELTHKEAQGHEEEERVFDLDD